MRLLLLLLLITNFVNAQKTIDVNSNASSGMSQGNYYTAGGVPLSNVKFVNLKEGSPYFSDEWMSGLIVSKTGQRFASRLLKLDLLNKEIHFINSDGAELISTINAREIIFSDTANSKRYYFFHASCFSVSRKNPNEWFEMLDTGKISLYKAHRKLLSESLPHTASTYEQRIATIPEYFIGIKDTLIQVKKGKDISELVSEKRMEFNDFLKAHEKNTNDQSSDERWKALVKFYNSLL